VSSTPTGLRHVVRTCWSTRYSTPPGSSLTVIMNSAQAAGGGRGCPFGWQPAAGASGSLRCGVRRDSRHRPERSVGTGQPALIGERAISRVVAASVSTLQDVQGG
jgi:hypothetical protein